jgi:tetratricopeptide (TPR) repeat protein
MAEIRIAMIHSTVRDLPEQREKVRDACLRQGVMPSMMEYWPAIDADGVTASLKKVDDAEIYIGVFAHRYGYVPKGHEASVTEMEYDRAVKRGIPRLIFLIDKEHPLKIAQVEIEAADKLQKLKERLKQERTVAFFKSPDDCGVGNVYAALGNHSRALQCEEKALTISNELFGIRSPIKAAVLKSIAFAYYGLRDLKRALEFALEALAMRKALSGDQHPETLAAMVEVVGIYCDSGHVHAGFQLLDEYLKKSSKSHSHHEWLKNQNRDFHARYFLPGFRQIPRKKR